ncbi:uncharacterized protein LOC124921126 [Impatiens glandulifera]|uniref:uncharacterized protein LOC124921126 n=1 Tax=Impatiens glandulifera TaxID=253017 RepID=UPI001FB07204|nr:uncharacterized protein LOC124921126 [Impatiens glandulifera]
MGHGYTHPTYHALCVRLLRDAKKSVELIVEDYRKCWKDSGCTIMTDGWMDGRQRSLINFLVSCPKGITLVKFFDASGFILDASTLCNMFYEIFEWTGVDNVVQLVTDNGANYKAADKLLSEKYMNIIWSPCAAHCINLIFKDICEMPLMKMIATLGSKITIFVYNHKLTLNWLRVDLEALVVSQVYSKYLKISKGIEVKQIVLNYKFWTNVVIAVKLMAPLMRLLRICDADDNPAMGYVYEGMLRALSLLLESPPQNYMDMDIDLSCKSHSYIVVGEALTADLFKQQS